MEDYNRISHSELLRSQDNVDQVVLNATNFNDFKSITKGKVDLSKIGTVESSNIGCAIKFSGSLLILFLKIFNSFLVALDPISIP